jgi:acyl carrier protein
MMRAVSVPWIEQLDNRHDERVLSGRFVPEPQQDWPVARAQLTRDRVVAEIIRAVRELRTSFSEREVTGDTNLALDLGLESASRVELLLDVQRALDVALDVGVAVMFAELTITELAELIVALPQSTMDR